MDGHTVVDNGIKYSTNGKQDVIREHQERVREIPKAD